MAWAGRSRRSGGGPIRRRSSVCARAGSRACRAASCSEPPPKRGSPRRSSGSSARRSTRPSCGATRCRSRPSASTVSSRPRSRTRTANGSSAARTGTTHEPRASRSRRHRDPRRARRTRPARRARAAPVRQPGGRAPVPAPLPHLAPVRAARVRGARLGRRQRSLLVLPGARGLPRDRVLVRTVRVRALAARRLVPVRARQHARSGAAAVRRRLVRRRRIDRRARARARDRRQRGGKSRRAGARAASGRSARVLAPPQPLELDRPARAQPARPAPPSPPLQRGRRAATGGGRPARAAVGLALRSPAPQLAAPPAGSGARRGVGGTPVGRPRRRAGRSARSDRPESRVRGAQAGARGSSIVSEVVNAPALSRLDRWRDLLTMSKGGIRDVILMLLPQVVIVVTGFVTTVLIARGLGPAALGHYGLVLSVAGLTAAFSDMGIGQTAIRYAARAAAEGRTGEQMAVLRWALRLRLALVLLVGIVLALAAPRIAGGL